MHTPEQIEKWAREAGVTNATNGAGERVWCSAQPTSVADLTRFAALVAQHERERCKAVIELWGNTHEPWMTVNAQNMSRKLQRAIDNPGVRAAAIRNSDGG